MRSLALTDLSQVSVACPHFLRCTNPASVVQPRWLRAALPSPLSLAGSAGRRCCVALSLGRFDSKDGVLCQTGSALK